MNIEVAGVLILLKLFWSAADDDQDQADPDPDPSAPVDNLIVLGLILNKDSHDIGPPGVMILPAVKAAQRAVFDHFGITVRIPKRPAKTPMMKVPCLPGSAAASKTAFQYANQMVVPDIDSPNNPTALLGPYCSQWVLSTGVATSAYLYPHATGGGEDISGAEFLVFPVVVRTSFNREKQFTLWTTLMDQQRWTTMAVIYDSTDHERLMDYQRFHEIDVKRNSLGTSYFPLDGTPSGTDIATYLTKASQVARVIGLFVRSTLLHDFLVQAEVLDMITGNYVYFTVDKLGMDIIAQQGTFYNAVIYLAFSRTFVPSWDQYTMYGNLGWNHTIPYGITGDFFIDERGDIREDYSLSAFVDGSFQPVMQWIGLTDTISPLSERLLWNTDNGKLPPDHPPCGFTGSDCVDVVGIARKTVPPLAIMICIIGFFLYRNHRQRVKRDKAWVAKWSDLNVYKPGTVLATPYVKKSVMASTSKFGYDIVGSGVNTDGALSIPTVNRSTAGGYWLKQPVTVRWMKKTCLHVTDKVLREVRLVKTLKNGNLMKFVGACMEQDHVILLYEFCNRGSLEDFIGSPSARFDWPIRFSFINDIVRGMYYINTSVLKVHGRLSSACCFADSHFAIKICDYALNSFFELNVAEFWIQTRKTVYYYTQLRTAPEIIREQESDPSQVLCSYSAEGDIYSFSIILQEIILKCRPYEMYEETPERLYGRLRQHVLPGKKPFRPKIDESACHADLIQLCERCWSEQPTERPSFSQIRVVVRDIVKSLGMGDSLNILEILLQQMEEHSANLQGIIEEMDKLEAQQKNRSDVLLYSNLPKMIADVLLRGETVDPTYLDICSIMVVDVMNFNAIAAASSADDAATFLTDLHSYFFTASQKFDCCILESYTQRITVASGLPVRNGILHARELGRLALLLLFRSKKIQIRHVPVTKIEIRFGIHSGPIVFGVVGQLAPRFCLFGESQNIAARMMSVEEAFRIRLSASTRNIIDAFGSFRAFDCDEIFVKGKGRMKTYRLVGEDGLSGQIEDINFSCLSHTDKRLFTGNTELIELQKDFHSEGYSKDKEN